MKKTVRILFLTTLLVLLFSTVTAFGASNKAQVKARANNFMKAAKKYNITAMLKNIKDGSKLKYIKDPIGKVVRYINKKHLTYTIKKITIKKSNAAVKVKCSYYDGYIIFKNAFDQTLKWYPSHKGASAAEIQKKIASCAAANYRKYSKTKYIKSATITLNMKRINKQWVISSSSGPYAAVINGNYQKAYNKIYGGNS